MPNSTLSPSLLAVLRCPESGQELDLAPVDLIHSLNEKIDAGTLHNRNGETPAQPLTAGLLRKDGALLYPIVDGFPVLLIDQALPVEQAP